MSQDKYSALWISHSSISSYLNCPRSYFLKHLYKDPQTRNRISIVSPSLTLGQIVHETLESVSNKKVEERFITPLVEIYDSLWDKIKGKKGGFQNSEEELEFKTRGGEIIRRVMNNLGPLINPAIKIKSIDFLVPNYLFSESENIILCGSIDWAEYIPNDNSIHIIDFKTGKYEEDEESLQLPIYLLLAQNLQKRIISKMSYWYIEREDKPRESVLPNVKKTEARLLDIGMQMKSAKNSNSLICKKGGCGFCIPFENILKKNAQYVGSNDYQDLYFIRK